MYEGPYGRKNGRERVSLRDMRCTRGLMAGRMGYVRRGARVSLQDNDMNKGGGRDVGRLAGCGVTKDKRWSFGWLTMFENQTNLTHPVYDP